MFEKYPKDPHGSSPQNVINPKLTRIFLTDVISKPDVKPRIIVNLPNDSVVNLISSHGKGESIMMKSGTIPNYLCATPLRHLSLTHIPTMCYGFTPIQYLDSPGLYGEAASTYPSILRS